MMERLIAGFNRLRSLPFPETDDIYRIMTDDGVNLVLKHYRPEPDAPFNKGRQPVLMMPGAACNFDYFDLHTPEGKEKWSQLPGELPEWARGDAYVKKDPMKLYNLAYYLYSRGYDVWLVNYRGQGRGRYRSFGRVKSSIDRFGVYDMKAAIKKVRELTGKRPVHLGHSMGGTMAFMYFQGACYWPGPNGRIGSDPGLAEERNAGNGPESAKGFVNLDGPRVPFVLGNIRFPLVTRILWYMTDLPIYYSFRYITRFLPRITGRLAKLTLSLFWVYKRFLPAFIDDIIAVAYTINPDNIDPDVIAYVAKYAADGGSAHLIGQYLDSCISGKMRESYRTVERGNLKYFPEPDKTDSLYYYSDNMAKITLPSIFLASTTKDITKPEEIRACYDAKTRHPLDEYHEIPNASHMDITCGLNAPYITFPLIGAWIEKLGSD
ncbi:MAG: alpha/beta fold hydrolase [Actinobacteria bacterium]|nr:alpha/beta fold hydrolase [Actinomycetota bacterium]